MNKFLEDFKSTKVLNTEDFLRIKKYIDNKFSSLDNKAKADILCTTIHQILDKFIIGEDSDLDSKVKQEVLRTNIFGGQPTTYLYDVLITYLKQCDFNKSNTIERLISWIKKYSKTSINEEFFITFLYEERYINETQREKLVQELVIVQDKSEIVKREDHKDNLTFKDVEEKHQNDEIAVTTIKKQNLIESKTIINKNNKKKHYRVTVIGIIVILIPSLYLGVKLINRKNINEMSLINNEEAKEVSRSEERR